MNVNLSPKLEKLVLQKVKSGRYHSATEVVGEALRLLDEYDKTLSTPVANLRLRIDAGIASLDQDGGVDGERFVGDLLTQMDQRRTRRKAK